MKARTVMWQCCVLILDRCFESTVVERVLRPGAVAVRAVLTNAQILLRDNAAWRAIMNIMALVSCDDIQLNVARMCYGMVRKGICGDNNAGGGKML